MRAVMISNADMRRMLAEARPGQAIGIATLPAGAKIVGWTNPEDFEAGGDFWIQFECPDDPPVVITAAIGALSDGPHDDMIDALRFTPTHSQT